MVRKAKEFVKEQYHTNDPVRHSKQMRNMVFALVVVIVGALVPLVWGYFAKISTSEMDNAKQNQEIQYFKEDIKSILDALDKQATINANTNVDIKLLQQDVAYYKNELGEIKRIVLKNRGGKLVTISTRNANSIN